MRIAKLGSLLFVISLVTGFFIFLVQGSEAEKVRQKTETAAQQEQPNSDQVAQQKQQTEIPLRRVVLFNSGVGYFERQATVTGNSQVSLEFAADKIDDLLKSMVVQNLSGGSIQTVRYEAQAPAGYILKHYAINLENNPSLFELLKQIRGEEVEIQHPHKLVGRLVSVEKRPQATEEGSIEKEFLTLRTEKGLRSIALEKIQSIDILDPALNSEFQQALITLARLNDRNQKAVHFNFTGQGEQEIRIGYIQKSPVWKMTYRLVLEEEQHLLQGWAIVENTTDHDWQEVQLAMVSGQPITYEMPLYEPLFVDRPNVQLDLYESLRPQQYEQGLREREAQAMQAQTRPAEKAELAAQAADRRRLAARAPAADADKAKRDEALQMKNLQQSVGNTASVSAVGELFKYEIQEPVTLPRQESALLPVINSGIQAEKINVYEQDVHAKHPLAGARLTNTTETYLMEGPLTVFEEGTYAGDSLLSGFQPGSELLVTYALALDLEVSPQTKTDPQTLVEVRINNGTLHTSHKQTRTYEYTIKNSGDSTEKILIALARDPNWELVSPEEPQETTRDKLRFQAEVSAGETTELSVKQQRMIRESIALTNISTDTILHYASSQKVNEKVKQTLREVADRKQEISRLENNLQAKQTELNEIATQQERIRKNMEQLDKNTDLYARYVSKLSAQEDEIEQLREQIEQLRESLSEKRQSLNKYLSSLDVAI